MLDSPCGAEKFSGLAADSFMFMPPTGMALALSVDTLVAGVHFPTGTHPADIGYKALAVNLSDMAAMGAEPLRAALTLTMPRREPEWLQQFCIGLCTLAAEYRLALTAAPPVSGPLAITVHIYGQVPAARGLRRGGARPGDFIYVTGTLGDAGLALAALSRTIPVRAGDTGVLQARLARPTARVREGMALREVASAAIDVSDGLAGDLGHILAASNVGASIELKELPLSEAFKRNTEQEQGWRLALTAGDDYELCFTVPPQAAAIIEERWQRLPCTVTRIGVISEALGLRCRRPDGSVFVPPEGYQHFG